MHGIVLSDVQKRVKTEANQASTEYILQRSKMGHFTGRCHALFNLNCHGCPQATRRQQVRTTLSEDQLCNRLSLLTNPIYTTTGAAALKMCILYATRGRKQEASEGKGMIGSSRHHRHHWIHLLSSLPAPILPCSVPSLVFPSHLLPTPAGSQRSPYRSL